MRAFPTFGVLFIVLTSIAIADFDGATHYDEYMWKFNGGSELILDGLVRNNKSEFFDLTGKLVIKNGGWDTAGAFHSNLCVVSKFVDHVEIDGKRYEEGNREMSWMLQKSGFIDKSGKMVILPTWNEVSPFREGLAWVMKYTAESGKIIQEGGYKSGKFGFIDPTGKEVTPLIWDRANCFSEGLASVCKDGKWGFIDKTGKIAIPLKWERCLYFSEGVAAVMKTEGTEKKWGYIDRKGEVVIPPRWRQAMPFNDGVAIVLDRNLGAIDRSGKVIVEPKWLRMGRFSEGLAHAYNMPGGNPDGGYIDKSGAIVIPTKTDAGSPFEEGVAFLRNGRGKDAKYTLIDKVGKVVANLERCQADAEFEKGLCLVDGTNIIDVGGRVVFNIEKKQ